MGNYGISYNSKHKKFNSMSMLDFEGKSNILENHMVGIIIINVLKNNNVIRNQGILTSSLQVVLLACLYDITPKLGNMPFSK